MVHLCTLDFMLCALGFRTGLLFTVSSSLIIPVFGYKKTALKKMRRPECFCESRFTIRSLRPRISSESACHRMIYNKLQ